MIEDILRCYKFLNSSDEERAKWKYIEILRNKDTFMTHQFDSYIYRVNNKQKTYQNDKEAELVILAIRPL